MVWLKRARIDILGEVIEKLSSWQKIQPKGSYDSDDILLFKKINEMIKDFNGTTADNKIDLIKLSFTPEKLETIKIMLALRMKKENESLARGLEIQQRNRFK